ncbi:MAG: hypothetical protein HC919_13175 [Oscillatoriales cyanobacterium SM2_2_1]|nr:hypothetical protein [Oscillatoriales cyanobacterium SM2_2_1]
MRFFLSLWRQPFFTLALLWLLCLLGDRLWFSLDQAPPAWDQGDHLTKAMHHWRVFAASGHPWFSEAWWRELWAQAPTQRAPWAYLVTVPFWRSPARPMMGPHGSMVCGWCC